MISFIATTAAAVLSAFAVAWSGYLVWKWQRRDPVTIEETGNASALAQVSIIAAVNAELRLAREGDEKRMDRMTERLDAHEASLDRTKERVASLERHLRRAVTYIERLLWDMRRMSMAPSEPIPDELAPLVDPELRTGWDDIPTIVYGPRPRPDPLP